MRMGQRQRTRRDDVVRRSSAEGQLIVFHSNASMKDRCERDFVGAFAVP